MTESAQATTEALMQFLYQAPIGLVQTDLDGSIQMINPMSAQLLMPLATQGDLSNLFDVLHTMAPQLREQAAAAPWPGGLVCEGLRLNSPAVVTAAAGETRHQGGAGNTVLSVRVLRLDEQTLMASVTDITAEARQESERVATELRDARRLDTLTGLPNRSVALERIDSALSGELGQLAVLFINGDRFDHVNVTLGQAAGDELLRLMAARIRGSLRQPDSARPVAGGTHCAARLGGDEFVVVLEDLQDMQAACVVAQRLVDALGQPYLIGTMPVHCAASVGVVLSLDADEVTAQARNAEAVLQDAGLAMRQAKRLGGGRLCIFEPAMKALAQHRAVLERELRQALTSRELFVVYQPITVLANGRVASVEALVRWQHPTRGLVSPIEFIGIAEETGLIVPLGLQVLNMACQQFALWQQQLGARAPQVLSVNLSRAQLTQAGLPDAVMQALAACKLPAQCLQLEVTESLAAADASIQARLHELKRLGVLLALDDFGTGYSSLSSLHQWPVDVIKIDRSFVSQIDTSPHHRVLVEATMLVARSLGMQTVAEGVETQAQADVLTALRCEKVQGYFYARPMDVAQATAWLQARPLPVAAGAPMAVPVTVAAMGGGSSPVDEPAGSLPSPSLSSDLLSTAQPY